MKASDKNPLIDDIPEDTLINVHASVVAIRELMGGNDIGRLELSDVATHGLSLLMNCIAQAMEFEQEQRKAAKP